MRKTREIGLVSVALVWCAWMALPGTSSATMDLQKKAKEAGFPATNCQYCHNEKLPKKDAATHNERGTWLKNEKAKRNAKDVDPAWLKDYPGDMK
jgi:hypothetical protein